MPLVSTGNFCLEGYIDVPEHQIEAVEAGLRDHIGFSPAVPGCIDFEVNPYPTPTRFLMSSSRKLTSSPSNSAASLVASQQIASATHSAGM